MHKTSNNSTYNIVINNLQNYMLTNDNINIISKKHAMFLKLTTTTMNRNKSIAKKFTFSKEKKQHVKIDKPSIHDKIIYPSHNDSLFWCFYITNESLENYFLLSNKLFETEKTYKINAIDKIRDNKVIIKQHKFKRTDIEDELANQSTITLNCFFVLSIIFNKNIFVIQDNLYFELCLFPNEPINVIHYNKSNEKYGIECNVSVEDVNAYKNNKWKVESLHKPLRAFSAYKLTDLYEICEKLCIEIETNVSGKNKKRKKQDLYQDIIQKIEQ